LKGGSGNGASLYGSSVRGTLRESSFAKGPEGYERKALGIGTSLHGGSVGQPGVGSSSRDFEVWLKGTLELECLSMWELCEGNPREGSLAGDPEGYIEKDLETGISFHTYPIWGTWRRARLPGTLRAG